MREKLRKLSNLHINVQELERNQRLEKQAKQRAKLVRREERHSQKLVNLAVRKMKRQIKREMWRVAKQGHYSVAYTVPNEITHWGNELWLPVVIQERVADELVAWLTGMELTVKETTAYFRYSVYWCD